MIVGADWLRTHVNDARVRTIDVRSYHGEPERGRAEYANGHIPGAVYLDLETDLAGTGGVGGRHPLPDLDGFAAKLGALGISRDDHIVAYDQSHGATSARLWWMLRHLGHERVSVLDGGWPAWKAADGVRSAEIGHWPTGTYQPAYRTDDVATRSDVAGRSTSEVLIDARDPARYRGEVEPIDPVAGHIPGAINIPHESLTRDGRLLPTAELTGHLVTDAPAIAYCGSGVTACYVILAHAVAGLPTPRLYVGSWSDWSGAGMPVTP